MAGTGDLVELFGCIATEDPDRVFLQESKTSTLSYGYSYRLVTTLLASQLCTACPRLSAPAQPEHRVVLISHNSSLFPLVLWSCWHLSAEVVLLSVNMDQSLWKAALDLLKPCLIIASHNTYHTLYKQLDKDTTYQIIVIDDLIPISYRAESILSRKSDYVPSLRRWIESESTIPVKEVVTSSRSSERPAVTLFTSSAVDEQSLKCVTYTHSMLVRSGERTIKMMGEQAYQKYPIRHLGCLPLSHCFEFCISLM